MPALPVLALIVSGGFLVQNGQVFAGWALAIAASLVGLAGLLLQQPTPVATPATTPKK